MTNQSQQKILKIVAVLCVCALIGDRLVFSPLLSLWDDRSQQIQELKKSVAKGTLLLEREDALTKQWSDMKNNALPKEMSAAENQVIKAIDRWVRDSRVNLVSIKPQWKREDDAYQTFECRAVAQGNMQTLARFIYELEQDEGAIKVESLDITSNDDKGSSLNMAVRFSGLQFSEVKK